MRTYVGDQEAANAFEFEELANGFDDLTLEDFPELFAGPSDETPQQRAIRLQVAREVLAELLEDSADSEIDMLNAGYAAQLTSLVPLRRYRGGALEKAMMRTAA